MSREAVIVSSARTGLAKSGRGGFNMTHGAAMGGHAIKHAIERANIEPGEVEEIFIINLDELFRPDSPKWVSIEESDKKVLQLPIRNRLIHAPTAALLLQFKEVALLGNSMRTDHIEEPVWAWK